MQIADVSLSRTMSKLQNSDTRIVFENAEDLNIFEAYGSHCWLEYLFEGIWRQLWDVQPGEYLLRLIS